MAETYKTLGLVLLLGFFVLLFTSRFLAIGGINPNVPLVFFAWLLSAPSLKRMKFMNFLLLLFLLVGFTAVISVFWVPEAALLAILLLAAFYPSTLLSGYRLFDFLAIQIVVCFAFYALAVLIFHGSFPVVGILLEAVYGIILSLTCYLFLHER